MSSRYSRRVPAYFGEENGFELEPEFSEWSRKELEGRFTNLKENLLAKLLQETETIRLQRRFRQAAGEAAGLAWTTEFPLLVFPGLFEELTAKARQSASRQDRRVKSSGRLMRSL